MRHCPKRRIRKPDGPYSITVMSPSGVWYSRALRCWAASTVDGGMSSHQWPVNRRDQAFRIARRLIRSLGAGSKVVVFGRRDEVWFRNGGYRRGEQPWKP